MIKNKTNKYLLFIGIFIMFIVLPCSTYSQLDLPGQDILLKEYLFPISSYIEVGSPVYQQGLQCLGQKLYDNTYEELSYADCADLNEFDSADPISQWADQAAVFSSEIAQFKYRFTIEDTERYVFKVNVSNDQDDFNNLTREQIDYIFADYASDTGYDDYNKGSYLINTDGSLNIQEYSLDNGVIQADSNQRYDLFRSMIFSVAVGSFDQGGTETIEKKGYMIVKNNGSADISEGEVVVGVLEPGEHNIYLNFLTDFYYDFAGFKGEIPSYFREFDNADLDDNDKLDVNPVIHSVGIDAVKPADDVVGLRIYSNQENIAPRTWYSENVINASPSVEDILVDGYRAIRDERTVYVHAANLAESQVCLSGPNEGQSCQPTNADAVCGTDNKICVAGENKGQSCSIDIDCGPNGNCSSCGIRRFFYTNIYVIAYNQAAQPSTINIFNQMFDNWVFNKNIIASDPINAEKNKDKIRRDTIRKADLSQMERLISDYHDSNGQYPDLAAGTLVKGHTISTWSSWQATLGNELGSALPVDPLNLMSTENRGPYVCTDPIEALYCKNLCEQSFYGCPEGRQCFNNAYCSICPIGYDSQTCWNDAESLFAYDIHGKNCDPNTGAGCCDSSIQGSFNLGGTECNHDGAYVYQYTALENGQAYLLNYRFEYTDVSVCDPSQCAFGNKCYPPGSCLASCDAEAENCGYCDNPSFDTETECTDNSGTWTSMEQYRNLYCYLGTWRPACGDGFVQNQCGETCDYNATLAAGAESWCDQTYGVADWHNEENINSTCTSTCEILIAGVDYEPSRYTYDLTDIDCGGYCGDFITQSIYGEQCDEGPDTEPIRKREELGSAGVSQASQYMCSGAVGSEPNVKNGVACEDVTRLWEDMPESCSTLSTTYPEPTEDAFFNENNSLISQPNSSIQYNFTLNQAGNYVLKLKTANKGADLSKLTDDQVDYLLGLALVPEATQVYMNMVTPDRDLDVPDLGLITDFAEKARIMRSLTFTVFVDGEEITNNKGNIIVPATTEQIGIQEGSVSLGVLEAGSHTVYIHFNSDWAIDLTDSALQVILANFANFQTTWLDKNAQIFEVSVFSPELGVGLCQSFGGYCGDGIVQPEFGEQCDIANYDIPTPAETTNLLKNPSFEGFITPWQVTLGRGDLEENESFAGSRSLRLEMDPNQVDSLYRAQILGQLNAPTISIGDNRNHEMLNYVKTLQGSLEKITVQFALNHELTDWSSEIEMDHDIPPIAQADNWYLYRKWQWRSDGKAVKFTYYSTNPATILVTDNLKIRAWEDQKQQYDCRNNPLSGKLCEYAGGYCGDGIVQTAYGEQCDSRAGMKCDTVADCGPDCAACNDICVQCADCNEFCSASFCGDGMVQAPNADGINEICDWQSDPDCSRDCQHLKMGGICNNSRPCDSGLSCTIRNFGDTETRCLGARGTPGCNTNSDCILGYYCNTTTSKCEPEISTYLKYHPAGTDPITLPSPPSPAGLTYDINITTCPYLLLTSGAEGFEVLVDRCTGIHWEAADNITQPVWTYYDADKSGCIGANRLPNILELYSLVRQTNQGLFYSDKEALRLCPVSCQYAPNEDDLCSDCVDDNYIYWSSTCSKTVGNVCTHALAVNFKYGSIEEYPVIDLPETTHNDQAKFKIHCLKTSECMNGIIEAGESCEFVIDGPQIIETNITNTCTDYGYDSGFLHCDPDTCNYRFENCYFNSQVNKSCEQVCQEKLGFTCNSVGLDVDDVADYYDVTGRVFAIAQDGRMMDIAGDNCDVKDIPEADNCAYIFQNKGKQCIDSVTGVTAPYSSQYAYCNCEEPSHFYMAQQTSPGVCLIQSDQNVKATTCDGNPDGNSLCDQGFYQQVNFSSPFAGAPSVIVTPYMVSDHPLCGNTMDRSVTFPSNITSAGFKLNAFGSPKPGSCPPNSGWMSKASASWLAVGTSCGVLSNTGIIPDDCAPANRTAKNLCTVPFFTEISFPSGFFGSKPHVLVAPEAVSVGYGNQDACVGGSTDKIICYPNPATISKTGFRLTCSGSPFATCDIDEGNFSHAQAGWLAMASRPDCQVASAHWIETTNCNGTLDASGTCPNDFYQDVSFGKTFSEPPHVIVSPENVSTNPSCVGGATDWFRCYAANITTTGFRAYCSGSVQDASLCGGVGENYKTQVEFGYLAVAKDCQAPEFQLSGGVCIPGTVRTCGVNVGECTTGEETCVGGFWSGTCVGATVAGVEVCDDNTPPKDEDCDGSANEGCECADGEEEQCGISNISPCQFGTRTCNNGTWGACIGAIDPLPYEICEGSIDDDCNTEIDNGCYCTNGQTMVCGSDIGACVSQTLTCVNGDYPGQCIGLIEPSNEICDGVADEDCDGLSDAEDPDCNCVEGESRSCYEGPGGTVGEGICQAGLEYCQFGDWTGTCIGQILPGTEEATGCDGQDNDCDGLTDEDCEVAISFEFEAQSGAGGGIDDDFFMVSYAPSGSSAYDDVGGFGFSDNLVMSSITPGTYTFKVEYYYNETDDEQGARFHVLFAGSAEATVTVASPPTIATTAGAATPSSCIEQSDYRCDLYYAACQYNSGSIVCPFPGSPDRDKGGSAMFSVTVTPIY